MKKIALCLMKTGLLLTVQPFQSIAANKDVPTSIAEPKSAESAEVKVLLLRLNEIKEMDKSNLKPSERKILRKEVRGIKTQLEAKQVQSGGVYISVGALVLILILLIILL